jgi:hypothetical protein
LRQAVAGKADRLIGLKENVIVGRLIPAGTGKMMSQIQREAERDAIKAKEEMASTQSELKPDLTEIGNLTDELEDNIPAE